MHFNFFGHDFYFLADSHQQEKAMDMLERYVFKPEVLITLVIILVYLTIRLITYLKKNEKNTIILRRVSPWVYLLLILTVTVFNRKVEIREVRWSFDPWFTTSGFHESAVLGCLFNICLFIPFGWLMYKHMKNSEHKIIIVSIIGLFTSVFTEVLQYTLARGVTAIDDAVMNTLGVFSGAVICCIFYKIKRVD